VNAGADGAAGLARRHRLQWWETLPWIASVACFFAFPNYLAFGTQVLITILFALSLDLVLGYAGIVTLGHAAFFGAGAYTVGMMAMHLGWNEPISGLLAAALVAGLIGLASGLVLLRTHGLALLMLTLCTMALLEQAANMGAAWTGGFDGMPGLSFGKILGVFGFDVLYYRTQYLYALVVLFACFVIVRTLVYSSFGQSLTGIRENLLRMHAVGAPVRARQVLAYTLSAALAGVAGALFTQANGYVNLAVLGLERSAGVMIVLILGGYGRLYGAFVGAIAYMLLEHLLAKAYPTAWQLGLGITLIAVALFARNGVIGMFDSLRRRFAGSAR
jgi:branched-chain amino acid transport system permease protein